MAEKRKPKVKVLGIERMHRARKLIEAGEYRQAAALLNDFCWSNATLQGEAGEDWSAIKLAALRLLSGIEAAGAQKLIGELWRKVMPFIVPG